MEIEQLRQDINDLLEGVVEHSNSYTSKEHLSSLDVNFVQTKMNKVQESLAILKYLLELKHHAQREENKVIEPSFKTTVQKVVVEESVALEEPLPEIIEEKLPVKTIEKPSIPEIKKEVEKEKKENPLIKKLSEGLTLNDRYLFANELCGKDMNAFNELVKSIDSCSSFDEAARIYSSMDWEIDNEHVLAFIDLVERKFS